MTTSEDLRWMHRALELAEEAARAGEVPVGAVAVHDGLEVGPGRNRRETANDPFAHAEMEALASAVKALGRWRLTGVTLYVTLEPCSMCVGAMLLGRIDRVVWGAGSPKAGALGGLFDLTREAHNHRFVQQGGVAADESAELLRRFFGDLRAAVEDERGL